MPDSSARPRDGHPRVVLCILDGVGYRTGPGSEIGNAVVGAKPAFYNSLFERYPFTTLEAGGLEVGLPAGQMGNSEVGHLTIVIERNLLNVLELVLPGDLAELFVFAFELLDRGFFALHHVAHVV